MAFSAVLTGTAQSVNATNGSATLAVTATAGWVQGATIQGTGIPAGARVGTIVSNTSVQMVNALGVAVNFTGTTGAVNVIVSSKYGSTLTISQSGATDYNTPQDIINAGMGNALLVTTEPMIHFPGGLTVLWNNIVSGAVFDFGQWGLYFGDLGRWQFEGATILGELRGGYLVNGPQFLKTAGPTFYCRSWNNGGAGGSNMWSGTATGTMTGKFRMNNCRFVEVQGSNASFYFAAGRMEMVVDNMVLDHSGDSAGANAGIGAAFGVLNNTTIIKANSSISATNGTNFATFNGIYYVGNYQSSPQHKFSLPNGFVLDGYAPQVLSTQFLGGFSNGTTETYTNPDYSTAGWGLRDLITKYLRYGGTNIIKQGRRVTLNFFNAATNAALSGGTLYLKSGSNVTVNAVQTAIFDQNMDGVVLNWTTTTSAYRVCDNYVDTTIQSGRWRKYGFDEQPIGFDIDKSKYTLQVFALATASLASISEASVAANTTAGINWSTQTITPTANQTFNQLNARIAFELAQTANSGYTDPRRISGSNLTLVSGWLLVVNNGITVSSDAVMTKLIVPTVTIDSGGVIAGLYQIGNNPSARLQTTGLSTSSLAVLDNTGATYDFSAEQTGAKTEYFAPGKTGAWTTIAERLGFKRQTMTFTPGQGGDFTFAPIWIPDTSLLITDPAVISARAAALSPNETLENVCHWRTTSPGIPYDLVSKDGTSVVIACDVHFVATASTPIAYDSIAHVMTIAAGAHHVPGSTLVAYRSPGKITIDAGVDFQCAYADVDGQRITVLGMDSYPLNVTWFMRYRLQGATSWTSITGTGNAKQLTLTAGIYEVEVRGDGYGWASGVIDTSKTLTLQLSRAVVLADDDTPQQLKAYDATLEAVFQFDPVAGAVAVKNLTGAPLSPGFGEVWRATQRIMNMPALVWTWSNPIKANALSQKIIIPDGNPITMYLTEDSTALVTITCPVVHEATGKSADDRVKGNTHGLYIKLGSQASAETAGLVDTIVSLLGGPAFDSGTHGLSKVKDAISQVQTTVNALHNTDISSLATHADALAIGQAVTALGQPLQASDYTAPTAAPSAASVASAVRTELGTELANLDAKVSTRSTLKAADIPAGLTAAQVWAHADRSLTVASGLTDAQAQTLTTINTTVNALHNTDISGLATHADAMAIGQAVTALGQPLQASAYTAPTAAPSAAAVATAVRTELTDELANIDAKVSTRSTLKAADIPAGLTADQVWSHADRTLSVASGLTPEQQQALDDLQAAVADLLKADDYTAPPTAQAIATQVELAVLDDGDGRALLQAIADKIGNENLSAAAVAAAVWAASGRTLSAPSGLTDAQAQMLQDVLAAIGNLPDTSTAAAATATALLGEPVEVGATVRGSLQLLNAFAAGHIKGAGSSTEKFTNLAGTKDVIVSTNDGNGNRRTVNIDVDRGA